MQGGRREIILDGQVVSYSIRLSKRARNVNLTVQNNGSLVVALPLHIPEHKALAFIEEKKNWVLKNITEYTKGFSVVLPKHTKKDYLLIKEPARGFIEEKVQKMNGHYNFSFNRVFIKNYRSQWGSCSSKRNLNFTYKLMFLPEELAEYVVVHELCHLKEFNHSPAFWELVSRVFPDYRSFEQRLKKYYLV